MERFTLDGYDVEALIGFGGTGEVWRAREVDTGEIVALKRLLARGAAATERLRREAGLLATVAGPHVIGVRRLIVDDDEAVMVLDFAAGGSLATILSVRHRLPAHELVTILGPIATALAAAHSRDLIHGDLTPANILFTGDGRPLLADFGVARALHRDVRPVEGTVDYLDPAVAAGAAPTTASDVFALGAVGYAVLAGHPPWGSGTPEELVDRAARGVRPPVAEVAPDAPRATIDALEWMMSLDPADRPDAKTAGAAILRSSAAAPVGLVNATRAAPAPPTYVVRPATSGSAPASPDRADRPGNGDLAGGPSAAAWRPWQRRIVVAGAAGIGLLGAVGVGVSLAGSGHGSPATLRDVATAATTIAAPPPATTAPVTATSPGEAGATAPARTQWFDVVAALDRLRARAFDTADADALAAVYVPSAAAYADDLATIRSMVARGAHAQGFSATVLQVRPLAGTPTTERLRVVDRLSRYVIVDAAGAVVDSGPARSATAFVMTLTDTAGGWRVARIAPG